MKTPIAAAQAWLGSGTWPATVASVALVLVFAARAVVAAPVLWSAVLVVSVAERLRDRIADGDR